MPPGGRWCPSVQTRARCRWERELPTRQLPRQVQPHPPRGSPDAQVPGNRGGSALGRRGRTGPWNWSRDPWPQAAPHRVLFQTYLMVSDHLVAFSFFNCVFFLRHSTHTILHPLSDQANLSNPCRYKLSGFLFAFLPPLQPPAQCKSCLGALPGLEGCVRVPMKGLRGDPRAPSHGPVSQGCRAGFFRGHVPQASVPAVVASTFPVSAHGLCFPPFRRSLTLVQP